MRKIPRPDFDMNILLKFDDDSRKVVVEAWKCINSIIDELNYQRERRMALEILLSQHGIDIDGLPTEHEVDDHLTQA